MREDPKLQMRNENWGPSEPSVHVLGFSCLEFKRCLMMNPLLVCTNGYMHGSFEQTASEHFLTLVTAVHFGTLLCDISLLFSGHST